MLKTALIYSPATTLTTFPGAEQRLVTGRSPTRPKRAIRIKATSESLKSSTILGVNESPCPPCTTVLEPRRPASQRPRCHVLHRIKALAERRQRRTDNSAPKPPASQAKLGPGHPASRDAVAARRSAQVQPPRRPASRRNVNTAVTRGWDRSAVVRPSLVKMALTCFPPRTRTGAGGRRCRRCRARPSVRGASPG